MSSLTTIGFIAQEIDSIFLSQACKNNLLFALISNFDYLNRDLFNCALEAFYNFIPFLKSNMEIEVKKYINL